MGIVINIYNAVHDCDREGETIIMVRGEEEKTDDVDSLIKTVESPF